jgi:hypothetical protein
MKFRFVKNILKCVFEDAKQMFKYSFPLSFLNNV